MNFLLKAIWNIIFNLTGIDISFDAKYPDWSFYGIEFEADYQEVHHFLSTKQLTPVETTSGDARLQIIGCQMRQVQIAGPYNEVSIQVPVLPIDSSSSETYAHIYLPVSTEAARWPGADIMGFPKFLANIDITRQDNTITCQITHQGELVLQFSLPDRMGIERQFRWNFYGYRKQQIVRTSFDIEGKIYEGAGENESVDFTLGHHKVANELRSMLKNEQVLSVVIGNELSGILRKPVVVTPS
jgi:hypothetical protein